MDIVLCVYFTKTNIHTFIIQRSKASSDFEASCKRCMPLSSLCIGDHEEKKYVFGLSTLGFSELIPNSIILSDPTDFMRIPIIPSILLNDLLVCRSIDPGWREDSLILLTPGHQGEVFQVVSRTHIPFVVCLFCGYLYQLFHHYK